MVSIGLLISSHTPRWRNGAMSRLLESVTDQIRIPDQVAIAVDHEGRGAAWCKNEALRMLSTDLVAVVDSDDLLYNNHLVALEEAFLSTDCDIAYSNWDGVWPFPQEWKQMPWDPEHPRHTSTTVMYRRDLMIKAGGYREATEGQYAEDDWYAITDMLTLGAKVHHVIETTWRYNDDKQNTSGLARNWKL